MNGNPLGSMMTNSLAATGTDLAPSSPTLLVPKYDNKHLLELADRYKKECFDQRWVWEREWMRNIHYINNRQWIYWHPTRREWLDKRMSKDIPRPVTNKLVEVMTSLRSSFGAINLGVLASPIGHNPESVSAAEIAGKISPLIHDEHQMTPVMRENDFWYIVTGNAAIQISWDTDKRFNRTFIPHEQCTQCEQVIPPAAIVQAGQRCPICGSGQFQKALRPDGQPDGEWKAYGRGKTTPLSPFEYAFPPHIPRFSELDKIIRLRWRDKPYYEANHPNLVERLSFDKSPQDRSLQLYKSLAFSNDLGTTSHYGQFTSGATSESEGVTEYEFWIRPTTEFPEGFVMRVIGDRSPILLTAEEEGLPGPFPYKDIEGNPLFPFAHAPFEQIGGRIYGRSCISPLVYKQDQINRVDSLSEMIMGKMANPVWVIPQGVGLDQITGDPGLVIIYNALAAGGNAKPERIAGENIPPTIFQLRTQYINDLETLAGTFDIMKGNKPAGVEAFAALSLLDERSKARFTSAFTARGELYKSWFQIAIELERQFGPRERVKAIIGPNKTYTFEQFEQAQLQGNISIFIEGGTDVPKTSLQKRASIEHANQLGALNMADPEQNYQVMTELGLARLIPSVDIHVQTALQLQELFEQWATNPVGPNPLTYKPWYRAEIHWSERLKWLNTDRMRDLLKKVPELEQILVLHLQELQMVLAPPPMATPERPNGGVGAGRAMQNSNMNAGSPTIGQEPRPQLVPPPVR